jgi:hypothetical protein
MTAKSDQMDELFESTNGNNPSSSAGAVQSNADAAGGTSVALVDHKINRKGDGKTEPTKGAKRPRRTPLFPASTFEDALELAIAIYEVGSGQPVRRITLFDSLGKSPDSGTTRQLVTNSAKYGLTTGSYSAEFLNLTPIGLQAVADEASPSTKVRARFKLAIENVEVFKALYEAYLGNRLPAQAVLMDKARELGVPSEDVAECVETFTVNTKFVGVLRSISGAERLLSIDNVIDDFSTRIEESTTKRSIAPRHHSRTAVLTDSETRTASFDNACFYITPIGEEGSEQRKHADLFMGALVEPALAEFDLRLVRADKIGEAGMITGQIIEHIIHSKLVIVDLSFHNPNVFYELALRHAVRKPIVQISRAIDKLPFDIGQVRTIVVDTTDIYTLVPQLDSLKAQIAAQIRKTLDESSEAENPLSIFAPHFWDHLPSSS